MSHEYPATPPRKQRGSSASAASSPLVWSPASPSGFPPQPDLTAAELRELQQSLDSDDDEPISLHTACARGPAGKVEALLALTPNANLEEEDKEGKTPLHHAILNERWDVVKVLAKHVVAHNPVITREEEYFKEKKTAHLPRGLGNIALTAARLHLGATIDERMIEKLPSLDLATLTLLNHYASTHVLPLEPNPDLVEAAKTRIVGAIHTAQIQCQSGERTATDSWVDFVSSVPLARSPDRSPTPPL